MAKRNHVAHDDTALSLDAWRKREGLTDADAFLAYLRAASDDAICATLCTEGCEVECDGSCEHGHASVMLAVGVI